MSSNHRSFEDASKSDRASGGFTLIEVLVALTVLSVSLAVIYSGLSASLKGRRTVVDYQHASLLAESKLATIGVETPLEEGQTEGRFDERFRWRSVIAPYEEEGDEEFGGKVRPVKITVTVFWGERGEERSLSLSTLQLLSR